MKLSLANLSIKKLKRGLQALVRCENINEFYKKPANVFIGAFFLIKSSTYSGRSSMVVNHFCFIFNNL